MKVGGVIEFISIADKCTSAEWQDLISSCPKCQSSNNRRFVCSVSRNASLSSLFSVIFDDSLTLNLQLFRAFEGNVKPSKNPVIYVKESLRVDQEFRRKMLNKFNKLW